MKFRKRTRGKEKNEEKTLLKWKKIYVTLGLEINGGKTYEKEIYYK